MAPTVSNHRGAKIYVRSRQAGLRVMASVDCGGPAYEILVSSARV
jgi:hypothetical protein